MMAWVPKGFQLGYKSLGNFDNSFSLPLLVSLGSALYFRLNSSARNPTSSSVIRSPPMLLRVRDLRVEWEIFCSDWFMTSPLTAFAKSFTGSTRWFDLNTVHKLSSKEKNFGRTGIQAQGCWVRREASSVLRSPSYGAERTKCATIVLTLYVRSNWTKWFNEHVGKN